MVTSSRFMFECKCIICFLSVNWHIYFNQQIFTIMGTTFISTIKKHHWLGFILAICVEVFCFSLLTKTDKRINHDKYEHTRYQTYRILAV